MKLSVTLASLVYLTPAVVQAFPHSYEDGSLDVRDAPEALHRQLTQNHDAEPIEGSPDENLPHLIYEKLRRDAGFNFETAHDVSGSHGEELMIERDAPPAVNPEANTYPHYRHHGEHSKKKHTQKHSKSQKTHQSKQQMSQHDEQSQGATSHSLGDKDSHEQSQGSDSYGSENKDTAKAKNPDRPVSPQYASKNYERAVVNPSHEERDVKGAGHLENVGGAAHTTHPHKAKATHFIHGEKDKAKPQSPDFHAKLNRVAAVQGKVPVKPAGPVVKPTGLAVKHHEARDAQEANPHAPVPDHSSLSHKHNTVHKAHGPKATHFVHGEKNAAKPHNPQFHSILHDVAAKQGRVPVKPAAPVVKATVPAPAGLKPAAPGVKPASPVAKREEALLEHHRQVRDFEPATTYSHSHHRMGAPIPLASKTAIQEKVAKILEHEFPQYSANIEQHLKDIQAKEAHIMTKRAAEPLSQATLTSTASHHHTRAHLPAASRVILEEKVAAVLEHKYPQYSGKIEQHLKQLQAHHQQHRQNPQSTGIFNNHAKREPEADVMGVLESEHLHKRAVVERHPQATTPPELKDQQGRKNAGYPINHAALPPASRSILNEEIASILEEEYPQYSSKIAAHMKAYRAKHTGSPNAYQAGILGVQQPAMKDLKAAKPTNTDLPKREVDTLMDDDGAPARSEPSHTTHSHLRGTGVLLKDYPDPTGYGHFEDYEQTAMKEAEPQADNSGTKLSNWEQYLLNATLYHQLFAAPAEAAAPQQAAAPKEAAAPQEAAAPMQAVAPNEAAAPNPLNAPKVEARGVSSMADPLSVADPTITTTTKSHGFGYYGHTHVPHVPAGEEAILKQVIPLQKLAKEVLQGTATVSGGYHMASASGVIISALEKELPVGPDGQNENMLDLDVSMPAAAMHEPESINQRPFRPFGMEYPSEPDGMSGYHNPAEGSFNIPQPGERTGRSGAPGWLSELVAEDRALVSSVDPKFPLPTGSLQQQLAAFNELEATISSDSPLATNTHFAAQLAANNGLMYDGPIPPRPAKPGQQIPPADDSMPNIDPASGGTVGQAKPPAPNAMPNIDPASGGTVGQTGQSNPLANDPMPNVDPASGGAVGQSNPPAPNAIPNDGSASGGAVDEPGQPMPPVGNAIPGTNPAGNQAPPAPGGKQSEHNVAMKAAANPYANAAGVDMSQDSANTAKLDPKHVPMEHMRRNLWEMLGVSDGV